MDALSLLTLPFCLGAVAFDDFLILLSLFILWFSIFTLLNVNLFWRNERFECLSSELMSEIRLEVFCFSRKAGAHATVRMTGKHHTQDLEMYIILLQIATPYLSFTTNNINNYNIPSVPRQK